MASTILATKLYAPSPYPGLVPRARITAGLNEGLAQGHRLTLVTAPAGYGKTTLVGEWLRGADRPFTWLSLDAGDNDPARFLTYLAAALQKIAPTLGRDIPIGLIESEPALEAFFTGLINDIAAHPAAFMLVLDDYHTIQAEVIHQAVQFLLDHQPAPLHLVLISRETPPFLLSRWRARGQITEIRLEDLRFTRDETAAFLNRTMRLNLAPGHIAALEARTEGWIAALQLAALSLQGQRETGDITGFIEAFGRHHYLVDYLAEEVLRRQSEAVRQFLHQTAILDRLTGSLCNALTGRADGQATLELLERANLFIVPLDDHRDWYRYHHLFADLLRQRLAQLEPVRLPELHRRASRWHEAHGYPAAAIEHALAAGDFDRAARLVDEVCWELRVRGELLALRGWLKALPGDRLQARPRLSLAYVEILWHSGETDAAVALLATTEQVVTALIAAGELTGPGGEDLLGEVAAFRALMAVHEPNVDPALALALANQALARLPATNFYARGLVHYVFGWASRRRGQISDAIRVFGEAGAIAQQTGHTYLAISARCNQAASQKDQGRLVEAMATYRQALTLAGESSAWPVAGVAHLGLAELYLSTDLAAALVHAETALALCHQGGLAGEACQACLVLAQVKQAQDDLAGSRAAIEQARQVAELLNSPDLLNQVADCEARLGSPVRPATNATLLDPLTGRELEVLRLVARGLSNRAIAATLVVTTGTVKTHLSRLMQKLNAGSRTEAVARARNLGLL